MHRDLRRFILTFFFLSFPDVSIGSNCQVSLSFCINNKWKEKEKEAPLELTQRFQVLLQTLSFSHVRCMHKRPENLPPHAPGGDYCSVSWPLTPTTTDL